MSIDIVLILMPGEYGELGHSFAFIHVMEQSLKDVFLDYNVSPSNDDGQMNAVTWNSMLEK